MNAQVAEKRETNPAVTPAAYNSLIAAAQLRDIRLIKADFSLDPSGLGLQENWKLSQACEIQQAEFSEDTNLLISSVEAWAACKLKSKKVVSIRCRYIVVYDVKGSPEPAAVDAFAKRVARFAAYPYFRSHVAEISSQAGLSLPPLPIIKEVKFFPKVPEENKLSDTPKVPKS